MIAKNDSAVPLCCSENHGEDRRYDMILFDLDGTLTDPGLGITDSVIYALKKLNLDVPPRSALYSYIGPPLAESFAKNYDLSPKEAQHAVEVYREYFSTKGLFENKLYQGIVEMLSDLKKAGIRLIVATSKPTVFAEKILRHFGIDGYFDEVFGSDLDGNHVKKADIIGMVLREYPVSDPERVIMVGDRMHDVDGATENGIGCIGVTYGYGSREELLANGALSCVDTVQELCAALLC